MGVEQVITLFNLFHIMSKIWLNPLHYLIIIIMFIKYGMNIGRL
jgi:hypothetical protein